MEKQITAIRKYFHFILYTYLIKKKNEFSLGLIFSQLTSARTLSLK